MQPENTPETTQETTRERILDAACKLFADKGYRGASVTEICEHAGVNIAAISYYFGGKEALYQEVWRYAHGQLMKAFPPDGGVAASRPAAERLRGRIRAALQRAMQGDGVEFGIMRNEMASPTGLLHQVVDDTIHPLREAVQGIMRELLGPHCTEVDIELCEICVVSPWMNMKHRRQAKKREGLAMACGLLDLETMVAHFTAFSLAGIRGIREEVEARVPDPHPSTP